jgi:Mg/Co/Ni transporter MgtE
MGSILINHLTLNELSDDQIDFFIQMLSEEKAKRLIKENNEIEIFQTIKNVCSNIYNKLYTSIMNDYMYNEIDEDKEELELNELTPSNKNH